MATSIYGGGARRSTAPVVNQMQPSKSGALVSEDALQSMLTGALAGANPITQLSQSLAGSSQTRGSTGSEGYGSPGGSTPQASKNALGQIGNLSGIGATAAAMLGEGGLAQMLGKVNTAASVATGVDKATKAENIGEVATAMAPSMMKIAGVPGLIAAPTLGFMESGVPGAVSGVTMAALSAINPVLGALAQLLGVGTAVKAAATPVTDATVIDTVSMPGSWASEQAAGPGFSLSPDISEGTNFGGSRGQGRDGGFGGVNNSAGSGYGSGANGPTGFA